MRRACGPSRILPGLRGYAAAPRRPVFLHWVQKRACGPSRILPGFRGYAECYCAQRGRHVAAAPRGGCVYFFLFSQPTTHYEEAVRPTW